MDSGNHCAMREKGEISWCLMPLLQTRQVRTGLPCHGCHACVAMRCCISLATFHQTSSDCSIFQATRRCKGSSRRLHFRGGLVCTHTNTHMHSMELIAIPLYLNFPPGGKPRQRFEGFWKKCRFRRSETIGSCPKIGWKFPGILKCL